MRNAIRAACCPPDVADGFHSLKRNNLAQTMDINRKSRSDLKGQQARILWFTGLSAAGKSTIANLVDIRLHALGKHTYLLDGDNLRLGLNKDLGFSAADRVENIRRVAEVAGLMVDAGLIALVAFISPFRRERALARRLVGPGEFIEIFVDTPIAVAEARDPKGLYKKARRGELKDFTGIDSPYEPPENPEIRIDTTVLAAEDAAEQIVRFLTRAQLSTRSMSTPGASTLLILLPARMRPRAIAFSFNYTRTDPPMNGAESLVRSLLASGVDTCFANPGTSEMHFVAALDKVEGMRCILGMAETVVTGCADGYGAHGRQARGNAAPLRAGFRQRHRQRAQRAPRANAHGQYRRRPGHLPPPVRRPAHRRHRGPRARRLPLGTHQRFAPQPWARTARPRYRRRTPRRVRSPR